MAPSAVALGGRVDPVDPVADLNLVDRVDPVADPDLMDPGEIVLRAHQSQTIAKRGVS